MTDHASERARALVYEWGLGTVAARAAVDALKSDPDLLADLALEAGGLEQVGWRFERTWGTEVGAKHGFREIDYGTPVDNEEPIYLRKGQGQ